jgi:raffinose/stachyose/melibiose transport system permease protein
VFGVFFIVPTALSFYFSLTRWTLFDATFIGLQNFETFLRDPQLTSGLIHTIVYALVTCAGKVALALPLAMLLTSRIRTKGLLRSIVFFPTLVSIIAIGVTFSVLMQPTLGLINTVLRSLGIAGPDWLGNPDLALYSVILVDVWQGLGFATVIFIAGILAIPQDYFDAVRLEGGVWAEFRHVILPLTRNAAFTVILLAFIFGLRRFDLIWSMTSGGPGFASDVLTSVIYKQYGAGYFGLSTAGNVLLFILITLIVYPLLWFFTRREIEL